MTTYLMNTTGIFTDEDELIIYYKKLTVDEVKRALSNGFISAIGHESTAEIITELIGVDVPFQRYNVNLKSGDIAICFQISPRPPEATILTKEEIERDYTFTFKRLLIASIDAM